MICRNPNSRGKYSKLKDGKITTAYCSKRCKNKGTAIGDISKGIIIMMAVLTLAFIGDNAGWNVGGYLFILFIVGFNLMIMGMRHYKIKIKSWMPQSLSKKSRLMSSSTSPYSKITSKSSTEYVPKIHVKELNKDFLSCCYQEARYGKNGYCVCGRVISKELKEIFAIES